MFRVIKLAETAEYGFDKIFKGWGMYVEVEPTYTHQLDFVELKMTTQKQAKLVEGLVERLVEKLVENGYEVLRTKRLKDFKLAIEKVFVTDIDVGDIDIDEKAIVSL